MKRFFTPSIWLCIAAATLLAGCSSVSSLLNPPPAPTPSAASIEAAQQRAAAERDLAQGRRAYEDGDYRNASRLLQNALAAKLPARDRVAAHKYLAFIHCAQSQFEACRAQFNSAFEASPQFELSPSESGHPLWGPVYREIAAEFAKRRARK